MPGTENSKVCLAARLSENAAEDEILVAKAGVLVKRVLQLAKLIF